MAYANKQDKRDYDVRYVRARRKKWLDENGPCQKCGSNSDLEIDHIDPTTKSFNMRFSWSWKKLNPELAKCQVLCCECHMEKTLLERPKTDHGRLYMYQKGCRCDECKAIKSADNKKRIK